MKLLKKDKEKSIESCFGIWKDVKGSSIEYVNKIRKESENRIKQFALKKSK